MKSIGYVVTLVLMGMIASTKMLDAGTKSDASVRLAPKVINYQGYLTDSIGVPYDTSLNMTFKIFDDPSAGNEWWSEIQTGVSIAGGVFSVVLGSVTAIPDSVFTGGANRWLELILEGPVTLSPRTRITSSGFAYIATYSDTAEYARNAAVDNDWSVSDSVLYTGEYWGLARGGADNELYGNEIYTHVNFGRICTTGVSGADFHSITIGGGSHNRADSNWSTIAGGLSNKATGAYTAISGGAYNETFGRHGTIGGGYENLVHGVYGGILAGLYNDAGNVSADTGVVVLGGVHNDALSKYSTIGGGRYNYIDGDYSAVLGGYADTITSTGDYSYLFGINSNLTQDSTFMVDMPHIRFGSEANGYELPSVDGSADQVLVTDGSGSVSWSDAPSDGDWVIAGSNMYSGVSGRVGIGVIDPGGHRLYVQNYSSGNAAVRGTDQSGASIYAEGQLAVLSPAGLPYNPTNIGVLGIKPNLGSDGVAVYGWNNDNGTANHALYAVCDGISTTNYGLYAKAINGSTNWAGYFDGDVNINGDLMVSGTLPDDNDWTRGTPDSVLFTSNLVGISRGAASNLFYGDSAYSHINLGVSCTTGTTNPLSQHITISGGYGNKAMWNYSTVSGGFSNNVHGSYGTIAGGCNNNANSFSFVGGGYENSAGPNLANYISVGGGQSDTVKGRHGSILGGYSNLAGDEETDTAVVIAGGWNNSATEKYAFVGGGRSNTTASGYSVLGGGFNNAITAPYCGVIVGGADNSVDGGYASVIGGRYNQADGGFSLAAGYHAVTSHEGSFVWGDYSSSSDFTTTNTNQFLIRAANGVGIGTNSPITAFHVAGKGAVGSAFTPTSSNANNVLNLIVGATSNGAINGISFQENTAGYDMKLGYNGIGSGDANMLEFYDSNDSPILSIQNGGSVMGYGDNGSYNFTFSNLSGYGDNGYIAVLDSNNAIQASMYVHSNGQGYITGDVKSFHMENPSQPGTQIWYSCIEGPEAAAYVRGTKHLDNGRAVIRLPQHFIDVASPDGITVQLTPLSAESQGLAVVDKSLEGVIVRELNNGNGSYEFDYMVIAVRKGYEDYEVIRSSSEMQPGISTSTAGSD